MFVDLASVSTDKYKVIIVGSGPAGTRIATSLAEKGIESLILETGDQGPNAAIQREFTDMTGYGAFTGKHWPRHWIRAFGGTSTVWAGWCATLDRRDMEHWPVSYDEMMPYYRSAASFFGRNEIILGYRSEAAGGFMFKPFSNERPLRVGQEYLDFFRDSALADVALLSSLSGFRMNEGRSRVEAIEVYSGGQTIEVPLSDRQQLVLAAGGIGNAQLLLTPPAGSDVGIGNASGLAGKYLMEHPHSYSAGQAVLFNGGQLPSPPAEFGRHIPALIPTDTLYHQNNDTAATIEFRSREADEKSEAEHYFRQAHPGAKFYTLNVRSEMKPQASNGVELTDEVTPSGLRKVRTTCAFGADDLNAVKTYLQELGTILARADAGRLSIDNDRIYRRAVGGGHIMGTTCMGADPGSSVVDRNAMVHGIGNLYVAGSSLFPRGGASNPTLTIVALAARLAHRLERV